MSLQLSDTVANARLDAIEASIGVSPKLQIRTGAPPANCAAADSGTLLVEIPLPADWMTDAANRQKGMNGVWSFAAIAAGIAGHFRIKDNADATTHMQGEVVAVGNAGTMAINNTNIALGQTITVSYFILLDGNA